MPHVTPAKGMLIPDPDRHDRLPEEGREVPDSDYWQRRLRDGDVVLTPRWNMWFNSIANEEPYQGLKCMLTICGNVNLLTRTICAGAAWSSSARALKCSLKWGNERNPYCVLYVSRETAPAKAREAR